MINFERYSGLFKSKRALSYFLERYEAELKTWSDLFSYYVPKASKYGKKRVGKVNRKDLADRVFSEFVRLYYSDPYGYVRCFTSGVKLPRYEADCGHYRSRDYLKYRFDITNCHPQTHLDNVILRGNYRNYHKNMVAEYGEEVEEKLWNDKELVDYNQERYEEHILDWYEFIQHKKMQLTL